MMKLLPVNPISVPRVFAAIPGVAALLLSTAALEATESVRVGGDAVECANLIYAGTKSSVCFSEKFLAAVGSETTINTSRKFKPVKLADQEIFRYPFAVMTGEGGFSLLEEERENLRRYLERGGFLLASAGCSSRDWDESFRREIRAVFPDRELAAVPMDHPLFHTVYEIRELKTHGSPASLEGLSLGAKIVLVYSRDGLNDTSSQHGCCCCGGNEISNSQQVNANVLAYALLQ